MSPTFRGLGKRAKIFLLFVVKAKLLNFDELERAMLRCGGLLDEQPKGSSMNDVTSALHG